MEKNKIQNLHPQHTQEQLPHSKNIEFITNLREKIKLEALKHTETTASAIKNAPNNKPNKLKTAQQKMKHLFQNISKLKEVLELKENMNRRIGKNINIWRTKNKTIHNQNKKHNKTNKKTPNYSIESEQLAHLYSQNTQERYIIACTNTEGVNSEIAHLHGDLPKLEILFQQVSQNN
jgi:succinate dehydrogenase/fumarate reductase flavoprotein subunit